MSVKTIEDLGFVDPVVHGVLTRRTLLTLAFLLSIFPLSGASAQLSFRTSALVGGMVTKRDTLLPMSPAFSAGAFVQVELPTNGHSVGLAPFLGASATVLLVERAHDLWTTMRVGVALDSPGRPRLFGMLGQAWPAPELEADDPPASRTVAGGGLSILLRHIALEARYTVDQRFKGSHRTGFTLLVGYTY